MALQECDRSLVVLTEEGWGSGGSWGRIFLDRLVPKQPPAVSRSATEVNRGLKPRPERTLVCVEVPSLVPNLSPSSPFLPISPSSLRVTASRTQFGKILIASESLEKAWEALIVAALCPDSS